jgi:uncharacterized membrane protein YqgA involved in biofilm formation
MSGPILNATGILLGTGLALAVKKPFSSLWQRRIKVGLGAFTVFFGLKLFVTSFHGSLGQIAKQSLIVLLGMVLGKALGKLLGFQKASNALGQFATRKMNVAAASKDRFNDGFLVCAALFCAAPLSVLASVQEGLAGFSPLFIVKALMDGAGAMAFAGMFGRGAALSALPVLALQMALTRGSALAAAWLQNQPSPMIDTILAVDGLLIFSVALVILQLRRMAVADYLPSLAIAPLLAWLFW